MVKQSEVTLQEKAVLGVILYDRPRGFRELQDAVERRFGELFQLNVFELNAILARLESFGFIERGAHRARRS